MGPNSYRRLENLKFCIDSKYFVNPVSVAYVNTIEEKLSALKDIS